MKIRDARIVAAIISGTLVRAIAAAEGVSERQVYRILRKPEVEAAIDGAARDIVRNAEITLKRGANGAARALVDMAEGKEDATPGRVQAARAVIEHAAGRAVQRSELTGKDGAPLVAPVVLVVPNDDSGEPGSD